MKKLKTTKFGKLLNKRTILSSIYFEKNHHIENSLILDGTGRSGTTWLAEILTKFLNYRVIFEPFNPRKVKLCKNFLNKQYIPPNCKNKEYYKIFEKILSGKIRGFWVNQDNRVLRPKGRIIKTIRASLFLKWLKINFPSVPIIYILRHPCAVVQSRTRLKWETKDVDIFLKQDDLVNDYLKPYINIISKAQTPIQKNAIIWCVENLIALNTMEQEDWIIVTYENLFKNMNSEMKKILNFLKIDKKFNAETFKNKISLTVQKDSAIISEANPLEVWKNRLTQDEINDILEIVGAFSLDFLYDENIMPKKNFEK
ncbi:MAG: sulfotransferase [Promethearchaeota archaeon]